MQRIIKLATKQEVTFHIFNNQKTVKFCNVLKAVHMWKKILKIKKKMNGKLKNRLQTDGMECLIFNVYFQRHLVSSKTCRTKWEHKHIYRSRSSYVLTQRKIPRILARHIRMSCNSY